MLRSRLQKLPSSPFLNLALLAPFLATTFFLISASYFAHVDGIFFVKQYTDVIGTDFVNYWSAARLFFEGKTNVIFDVKLFHLAQQEMLGRSFVFHSWSYPPHFLLFVLGLAAMPYPVALVVWLIGTFALYAFAVAYKRPDPWLIAFLLALAPASYENMADGQNGFLSAALLAGGLRLLPSRPVWAGVLFGFLTFKPQLGILLLIALLIGKHMTTIVSATLTLTGLVGISLVSFGIEPWQAFANEILPCQRFLLEHPPIYVFNNMMPGPFMAARILHASVEVAYIVTALFALGAVIYLDALFRRTQNPEIRAAAIMAATFLFTPYALSHDMTALSAAVIAFLATLKRRLPPAQNMTLIMTWLLPFALLYVNGVGVTVGPVILAAFLWMLWNAAEPPTPNKKGEV